MADHLRNSSQAAAFEMDARPWILRPTCPFVWYRLLALIVLLACCILGALFVRGPVEARQAYYPLEYADAIEKSACAHEVNPYWICAVIASESDWNPDATSSAGAVGLMQVMPETAQELASRGLVDGEVYSPQNLTDPAVNIEYGSAYLRYLVERYHQMEPAVAAYNAGMGNVDIWMESGDDIRDTIRFPETSAYLRQTVRNREVYEELYPQSFPAWQAAQQ